jgi:hypothetical protein
MLLYWYAIWLITSWQVDLIRQFGLSSEPGTEVISTYTPLTADYLNKQARVSMYYRDGVVFIFHFLAFLSICRYIFRQEYTLPKDRRAVNRATDKQFPKNWSTLKNIGVLKEVDDGKKALQD